MRNYLNLINLSGYVSCENAPHTSPDPEKLHDKRNSDANAWAVTLRLQMTRGLWAINCQWFVVVVNISEPDTAGRTIPRHAELFENVLQDH